MARKAKISFEPKDVSGPGSMQDEQSVEQADLLTQVPDEGLEVRDVNEIELGAQCDTLEKKIKVESNGERWEVLYFPRELLFGKFANRVGNLEMKRVLESEWFRHMLNKYGFKDSYRFKKDHKGKIMRLDPDTDSYVISQRMI